MATPPPSASDIKGVLESVGIEADDERLDKLISELEGKELNEVRFDINKMEEYLY